MHSLKQADAVVHRVLIILGTSTTTAPVAIRGDQSFSSTMENLRETPMRSSVP